MSFSPHSSPSQTSLPNYRFHGLAETQSQRVEEFETVEGLRIESQNPGLESDTRRDFQRVSPTRRGVILSALADEPLQDKKATSPPKAVSISPISSVPEPMRRSVNTHRRQRRDSPDSFAGDFSADPERQFLAAARQFDVPLSDLGRGSLGAGSTDSKDQRASLNARNIRSMNRVPSPPEGRVLVAATPSNTDSSQSQLYGDSEDNGVSGPLDYGKMTTADDHASQGYQSSGPSSSYERLLNGEASDPIVPELQATQPSTQPETETSAGPGPSATSGGTHQKNLLSLVHPDKMWRYQHYQNLDAGPVSNLRAREAESETSTRTGIIVSAEPLQTSGERNPHVSGGAGTRKPAETDQLEVPDSEPLRGEGGPTENPTVKLPRDLAPSSKASKQRQVADPVAAKRALEIVRESDQDSEDDEDEVPLVDVVRQKKKRHATYTRTPQAQKADNSTTGVLTSRRKGTPASSRKGKQVPLRDIAEVPSSAPTQDFAAPKTTRRSAAPKKENDEKSKSTFRHPSETIGRSKKRRREEISDVDRCPDDDDDNPRDDKTETATEGGLDQEDESKAEFSRKRTRTASSAKTRKTRSTGGLSSKPSKFSSLVTPNTRQPKRLRSLASSSRLATGDPTRVFALWKQDGHYYSGVVHSLQNNSRYNIKYDDGTEGTVTLDQMRAGELRVDDDVLVGRNTRSCKVVDASNLFEGIISIRVDDDVEDVHIADVRIAAKTITYAWQDRKLDPDLIVTIVRPVKAKPSPSPSKLSLASGTSGHSARKKILAKTGLVVTFSVSNENWSKDKDAVLAAIKSSGGSVIDDWGSIIRMEGRHSNSGNRWVIEKSDVKWTGKDEIERVFLLADDSNQKPKFLIALGLGIPCLSLVWLHESVESGEEKDWQGYMLPQGYSDALGARPSQQVDVDWGNSIHQLKDIMSNSVARKLLDGKSILCIGAEMVPQQRGRKLAGVDEKTPEAANAVPRIILSMGADRVEAVTDKKYASVPPQEYDLVVIKENYHYDGALDNGNVVPWTWVKDCLIASRNLPIPEWGPAESQDA